MKHSFKKNGGFTLVELIVAIAVAAIVTAAATTVLVLALRVNRQTGDTASQLITVRSLLSTMEKVASEGNIKGVVSDFDSWQLVDRELTKDGDSGRVVFGYDSVSQTIYTNGTIDAKIENDKLVYDVKINDATKVVEGIFASSVTLRDKLLTISIETSDGIYSSSILCRVNAPTAGGNTVEDGKMPEPDKNQWKPDPDIGDLKEKTVEYFLYILKSQYGSKGEILPYESLPKDTNAGSETENYTYYSEWYIGTENFNSAATGMSNVWNPKTPWCACFVSWALEKSGLPNAPRFAEVDHFMKYFENETYDSKWYDSKAQNGEYTPIPGDLVFFDWIVDNIKDPQHVGVVLGVLGDKIYTIEGNSAGRVMVRSYSVDSQYILGYGVLPWATGTNTNGSNTEGTGLQ